jgi:hypothetical protein
MTLVPPTDLPPTPTPDAPPNDRRVPHNITCEFCECVLTPHGHALKISDSARAYRDQKDTIADLKARIADLEAAQVALTKERDDAQRALDAATSDTSHKRVRW